MSVLLCKSRDLLSYAKRRGSRLAVLAFAAVLMSLPGCGGDDDPPTITGGYNLSQVDGAGLPAAVDEVGATITDGSITLDADGEWTMTLDFEDIATPLQDEGTYTSSDGDVEFSSTTFDDEFSGTVNDGTLQIDYDFDADGTAETELTFDR